MNTTKPFTNTISPPRATDRPSLLAPALMLLCLTAQGFAQGTMTITFEGLPSGGQYSESGMLFSNPYGPEHLNRMQSGVVSWAPDNGTAYLAGTGGDRMVFRFDTTPTTYFSLISFDIAEASTMFPGPWSFQIVGYPGMSQPVTNTITTDGIMDGPGGQPDFQTFYFGPSFEHLNHIEIFGDGWALDNVVIGGVPEPSAVGLILLGTLCLFGRSRARPRP